MAGNNVYVQGSYVDIHDNEVVNLSVDKGEVHVGDNGKTVVAEGETKYEVKTLVESADAVRYLFWGDSSMAVVFCMCRDCYGYADNMSQFEREFGCKAGVVSNTFGDNPYMRMPLANWKRGEVKQRVLQLVDAYKKAVVEAAKK